VASEIDRAPKKTGVTTQGSWLLILSTGVLHRVKLRAVANMVSRTAGSPTELVTEFTVIAVDTDDVEAIREADLQPDVQVLLMQQGTDSQPWEFPGARRYDTSKPSSLTFEVAASGPVLPPSTESIQAVHRGGAPILQLPVATTRLVMPQASASSGAHPQSSGCSSVSRPAEAPVALHCGHAFHKECIEQWLHRRHVCPLCREVVRGGGRALQAVF